MTYMAYMAYLAFMAGNGVGGVDRQLLNDRAANNRPVTALRNGEFVTVRWRDVVVGDILRLVDGEFACADVMLVRLAAGTEHGTERETGHGKQGTERGAERGTERGTELH